MCMGQTPVPPLCSQQRKGGTTLHSSGRQHSHCTCRLVSQEEGCVQADGGWGDGGETLEEAERRVGLQEKRDGGVQEVGLGDLRLSEQAGWFMSEHL